MPRGYPKARTHPGIRWQNADTLETILAQQLPRIPKPVLAAGITATRLLSRVIAGAAWERGNWRAAGRQGCHQRDPSGRRLGDKLQAPGGHRAQWPAMRDAFHGRPHCSESD